MPIPKTINLIQALRAVACLLVVLFHVSANATAVFNVNFCGNLFGFGAAGVDIFFVLSGFIITSTNINNLSKPDKIGPFLKKRVLRIYPVYWIIITFFLLLKFAVDAGRAWEYISPLELVSTYLLFPHHVMLNGVSWSLSFELSFYFLFAFSFYVKNKRILIAAACCYALFSISLYLSRPDLYLERTPLTFIFSPANTEFLLGVFAAILIPRIKDIWSLPLIISGIILFVAGAFIYNAGNTHEFPAFKRLLLYGIPSSFMIAGCARYEMSRLVKVNKLILSLGDASYSLYLIHLPAVAVAMKMFSKTGIADSLTINIFCVVLILLTCYGSILFFRFVEKPLLETLKVKKSKRIESAMIAPVSKLKPAGHK